jgi:hypothetical protein
MPSLPLELFFLGRGAMSKSYFIFTLDEQTEQGSFKRLKRKERPGSRQDPALVEGALRGRSTVRQELAWMTFGVDPLPLRLLMVGLV